MNDFINYDKSMSEKISKSKSKKLEEYNDTSQNISLSDLNLLANKDKLKKTDIISVSKIISKDDNSKNSKKSSKKSSSFKSSINTVSTSQKTDALNAKYIKKVQKENKDNYIYQKKLNFLNKLEGLYSKGFWKYYKSFSPNNLLSEIEMEYSAKYKESNVKSSLERMRLLLFIIIYGLEITYGYLDSDIQGWANSVHINIENGDYDNELMEIAEKWFGGESEWPVELRLLFSISISGGMFIVSKKFLGSFNDKQNTNVLGNIINSFMNTNNNSLTDLVGKIVPDNIQEGIQKQRQQHQHQQSQPQQSPHQSNPQPQQNHYQNQAQYQQRPQYQPPQQGGEERDYPSFENSDNSDLAPSKLMNKNVDFNEQEIENVLKKMSVKPNAELKQIDDLLEEEIEVEKPKAKRTYNKKKIIK